jgi:hypothetical protein
VLKRDGVGSIGIEIKCLGKSGHAQADAGPWPGRSRSGQTRSDGAVDTLRSGFGERNRTRGIASTWRQDLLGCASSTGRCAIGGHALQPTVTGAIRPRPRRVSRNVVMTFR